MLSICVADDEELCADRIRAYLRLFFASGKDNYSFTYFKDGSELLKNYKPIYDILFINVEMPTMSGIDMARRIRIADNDVIIIFITKIEMFTINGFEVNAFDFIIKPMNYSIFEAKLKKAVIAAKRKQELKIEIKLEEESRLWLSVSSIQYIEVFQHNLVYHTELGVFSARGSLAKLEMLLRNHCFRPCSRFCLINMKFVAGIVKDHILIGKAKICVSRRKRKEIFSALTDFMKGITLNNMMVNY